MLALMERLDEVLHYSLVSVFWILVIFASAVLAKRLGGVSSKCMVGGACCAFVSETVWTVAFVLDYFDPKYGWIFHPTISGIAKITDPMGDLGRLVFAFGIVFVALGVRSASRDKHE